MKKKRNRKGKCESLYLFVFNAFAKVGVVLWWCAASKKLKSSSASFGDLVKLVNANEETVN